MARVSQPQHLLHPCNHFMARRTRRLIEVDQAKANVLVERTLFRDTSEGWISLLLYLVQYALFPLPGSFLPWD